MSARALLDAEHWLPLLVLAAHVLAFGLSLRFKWSTVPVRWAVRLGMPGLAGLFGWWLWQEIGFGPQPQYLIPMAVALVFAAAAWLGAPAWTIWCLFALQSALAGLVFWFAFFFRMTRLF